MNRGFHYRGLQSYLRLVCFVEGQHTIEFRTAPLYNLIQSRPRLAPLELLLVDEQRVGAEEDPALKVLHRAELFGNGIFAQIVNLDSPSST